MRKIYMALAAMAVVLSLTGCDAFRMLAGRPTSKDLAQLERARTARIEAEKQAREDSIRQAEATAAILAQLAREEEPDREKAAEAAPQPRKTRYSVALGTFGNRENAEKLLAKAAAAGYDTQLVVQRSGSVSVFVNPTDDRSYAEATLEKILKEDFCPPDARLFIK